MRRWAWSWALALGACGPVVDVGPGSDAESGDPDPTTSTTATTADPSATTVTSASVSVSVSTTAETTDAPPPPPPDDGVCSPLCDEPADCCAGDPLCEESLGEYPYNYGCENGGCTYGECSSDDDCSFDGALMGWICVELDGYAGCMPGCNDDNDCADHFLPDWVCNGSYCQQPPCASDEDCGPESTCNIDTGTCVFGCTSNDICEGYGHCDPATGTCLCSSADECMDGYGCVPWP